MINEPQSVADLTALLEEARKNEREVEKEARKAKAKLRKAFLATHPYIYTVTKPQWPLDSKWGIDVEMKDRVYVSQKIDPMKYTIFVDEHTTQGQHILSGEGELNKSAGIMYYLTTDGIIHHSGGGTIILKTPQLCSDAEWAWLKSGNIPVKFLRIGENND